MRIRPCLIVVVATLLLAATGARAEVSEVSVAQQKGVSFLPLMWMEVRVLLKRKMGPAKRGRRPIGKLDNQKEGEQMPLLATHK